jgi:hypothetical protein
VLSALTTSLGALHPAFSPTQLVYSVTVNDSFDVDPFTLTATANAGAAITIDGRAVASGVATAPFALRPNETKTVRIAVKSGAATESYAVNVTNAPAYSFLKVPNQNEWFEGFGSKVALSGDTLVVAAPYENSKATGIDGDPSDTSMHEAGAVYVFTRAGETWAQQAYIKASNTRAGLGFGASLALDGDTLVVGAPAESSNATGVGGDQTGSSAAGAGAVYVFTRAGRTWTQQGYLKASNSVAGIGFGASLALQGDTLVVGAPGESSGASGVDGEQHDSSALESGAAYVFTRSGATWTQASYLKASNTHPRTRAPFPPPRGPHDAGPPSSHLDAASFGASLALSGDTLAVGSPGEMSRATGIGGDQSDTSLANAGAVYLFRRSGTTWAQEAYVKASNASAGSDFGSRVVVDGDTIAIGAFGESTGHVNLDIGAVYVLRRAGTTWAEEAFLRASNPSWHASFGISLALSHDVLAVGATGESSSATGINGDQSDTAASGAGAVYVFSRGASAWTQDAYVKAPDAHASGLFGDSVALSGGTLAVGAPDGMTLPRINGVYLVR